MEKKHLKVAIDEMTFNVEVTEPGDCMGKVVYNRNCATMIDCYDGESTLAVHISPAGFQASIVVTLQEPGRVSSRAKEMHNLSSDQFIPRIQAEINSMIRSLGL